VIPAPPARAPVREFARAKINLCLHVTGRRPDGYHLLESLVVFPEVGDPLTVEPASAGLSLALGGPFAAALGAGDDNLVLRAAEALRPGAAGAAILLEKRLPVASGMGGGSADAAAALRALSRLWALDPGARRLADIALSLGADVPVCLAQRPAVMAGIGERLGPAPALPEFWIALVNPMIATPTAEVFRALPRADNAPLAPAPKRFETLDHLSNWLAAHRNDLQAPAIGLRPAIGEALAALEAQVGARLARMTGSGATCFALFAIEAPAAAAAAAIRRAHPEWWVATARVPAHDPLMESLS
jgi:4-diphosphocytidyl-2-C-methyl-D-erythritol kinase